MILVSTIMVFRYARHNGVARNYCSLHWLVKSKMASIYARLSYKLPSFSIQRTEKQMMSTIIGFSGMLYTVCGWKIH